jgi:4-hydroxybenzoate polyprenyltransferase
LSGGTFSVVILPFLRPWLACFFTGTAVKIMDDYLDTPVDRIIGRQTWAARLEEAALPYALLALSLAVIAEPIWAITLFWASYAMGMRGDMARLLPLGLRGWQEALVLGVISGLAFGWKVTISSWLAIFTVQAIDDLVDQQQDKMTGAGNWASRWGMVETGLATIIAILILSCLDIAKLVLVLMNSFLVLGVQRCWTRKEDGTRG